jgi:hypothetical protein
MKKLVQILLLVILVVSSSGLFAQFDTEDYDSLENKILYNKQRTFGLIAHSLGVGIQFRTGKRITYFSTRMIEFEFVSMKSYNQVKMINPYLPDSRRYVFGKLNDAFFLRVGMIWKKLLNRKPYWGGVELRFLYGGGVSLGLAKPYYYYTYYIYQDPNGGDIIERRTERYNENIESYYGRAPFTKGLGEITLHPGLYGSLGLNFEYGKRNTRIRSLELGATFDVIPFGLSILANNSNQIIFPTAYLKFSLGKRYNKY